MTKFVRGDVVELPLPAEAAGSGENRQTALVVSPSDLEHAHGLLWVALVTKQENPAWRGDVPILDFAVAGTPPQFGDAARARAGGDQRGAGQTVGENALVRVTSRASLAPALRTIRGMKKTLHLVAGARPNFMKIAPIVRALQSCTPASTTTAR